MNDNLTRLIEQAGRVLLLAVFILAGCDNDGPVGPETDVTQNFLVEDNANNPLKGYGVKTGTDTLETNVDSYRAIAEEGTRRTYTVFKDGYDSADALVHFDKDGQVRFELTKQAAETAEVSASLLLDGEVYDDVTVYDDSSGDELASSGQFSLTRDVGTELTLRIEGSEIETQTETLVFNETKPIEISLTAAQPSSVQLTITPEIAEFTARDRAAGDSFTSYEVTVDGQTYTNEGPDGNRLAEGESFALEVAAGRDITVSGRFIYEQESRGQEFGRHRSLAIGETTVSPSEDTELELTLTHQPACSDNINNDDSDDVIDAQDNGCVKGFSSRDPSSPEFEYEPEDDNEILVRRSVSGPLTKAERVFSGAENERVEPFTGFYFTKNIASAIGGIQLRLKNKIETTQTGEEFALRIQCGPESEPRSEHSNVIVTDIVPDDSSVDGFRNSPVYGFNRSILQNGTDCGFTAVHATKVRGENPTDGDDDIFLSTKDDGGGILVVWFYESEEVE